MEIVASDLEGTLTAGVAWHALRDYLLAHGQGKAFRRFRQRQMLPYAWVKLGFGEMQPFKERWLKGLLQLFSGFSEAQFREVAEWVMVREMWPKRRELVLAELSEHEANGRSVVIVSGMFQPILDQFAGRVGYAGFGTPLVVANGRLTGEIGAPFNVGPRKVAVLRQQFGDVALAAAYGDTLPDVPMLEISEEPVAVSPQPNLRKVAEGRGWRVWDA